MIRSSTRITHQRCIDSRESDFDKPPGHFGSGVCSVKYRAHGGNRGRAAGWLAAWSNADAVFCLLSGPRRLHLESTVDKNEAFSSVFVYFRDRAMKHGYGQNAAFGDLPVKGSSRLWAKRRFLGSARKMQSPVTGKTPIFEFCP